MSDPFHPDMLDLKPFVRYDPATGKVVASGTQGIWFTRRAFERGEPIAATVDQISALREAAPVYVDTSKGAPMVCARPALKLDPSTLTPLPAQEVAIKGVPACTVSFTGPISGTQKHDGKDPMKIGWTVPGTYTLNVKAWPAQEASLQFEVKPASSLGLKLEVKP